jgi:hypothetical protein
MKAISMLGLLMVILVAHLVQSATIHVVFHYPENLVNRTSFRSDRRIINICLLGDDD